MKLSLINKHAIVCGSTDGIGKASALLLAKQGCEITLVARNQDKLDKTQFELNTNHNQNHYSVCADFDNSQDLKKKIEMLFSVSFKSRSDITFSSNNSFFF